MFDVVASAVVGGIRHLASDRGRFGRSSRMRLFAKALSLAAPAKAIAGRQPENLAQDRSGQRASYKRTANAPPPSIKLLIVAEHASARYGGEALIPFQYFRHFRQRNIDVHLLVHERTRAELYQAFSNDIERLHFVTDSVLNIWCNKIAPHLPDLLAFLTVGALSHLDIQIRQRHMAKDLVGKHNLNVIHQPTPVSPRLPSVIFGLSVPVIIGPMNGGMNYPPDNDIGGRFGRTILLVLRCTSVFWNMFLPGKRHAALLLVANRQTYEALPWNIKANKIIELSENGVDPDCFRVAATKNSQETIRIVYVGRLVDYKRVDLLLDACGKLIGEIKFQLDIVGDGRLRGALEKQVKQASLAGHVRFHGWIPQTEVAEMLRTSDIFAFPSMRECGGAVVLEAMASGVPVIATKWGGPADYLTEKTGILVAPGRPKEFVAEFANAILMMAKNPEARAKIGTAARHRAQTLYAWHGKMDLLLNFYADVVSTNMKNRQDNGR